jgi:hypothetical protein
MCVYVYVYAAAIYMLPRVGIKSVQFWSFVFMGTMFLIMASVFNKLLTSDPDVSKAVYGIIWD